MFAASRPERRGDPVLVTGIDFSSLAIDVVTIDLDDLTPPVWHRFPLAGQDAFDRTRSVRAAMPTASFYEDCIAIGIEHPAGKFGTGPMMRVQGAVLACLPAGVLVQPWPPASWRKAVGLKGNESKGGVASFASYDRVRHNTTWREGRLHVLEAELQPWPQDACDAYCIALATRSALDHPQTERAA